MTNIKRKKYNNFDNWKITQKYARILHNKEVVKWFKTTNSEGRLNLRNSLLIHKKDSANQIIVKMNLFKDYLKKENPFIIAYPEDYQVKVEASRPQLVIIFSPTEKGETNQQYTTHLPHYNGSKIPQIKSYYKGNFWTRAILKDNSHIIINGRSKTEAINVVKYLLQNVDPKYRVDFNQIKTGEYLGQPFKVLKMKPRRADFYSQGKLQPYPDWQYYFK